MVRRTLRLLAAALAATVLTPLGSATASATPTPTRTAHPTASRVASPAADTCAVKSKPAGALVAQAWNHYGGALKGLMTWSLNWDGSRNGTLGDNVGALQGR
ncbi:hypothetical protein SAM40697_2345 [Streptomyces ambofaciens]|uniref:Chitinase n=1 Tax=Streptomyces ambofaciens TaxID=1889 RepID=A0ABM6AYB5_STRAM|nr:hypothetical protein SAM40697_2345 [Streptomyces ambofaciens]